MIIDCGSLWRYVTACLWLGIVTDEGYPNSKVATSGPSGRLQICWMPPRWETVLQCGSSRALTMTELRITSLCLGMVTRNLTSRTIPTIELLPCSVDLRWKNFWDSAGDCTRFDSAFAARQNSSNAEEIQTTSSSTCRQGALRRLISCNSTM